MKIGIVGDAFIDRYWTGSTERVSPEAPIPVVKVDSKFDLPGGAANVRANLRSLGVEAVMLFKALSAPQNYPVKNRLMVGDVQLARWDENDFCAEFKREDLLPLVDCNAIVVSDYGKGAVSQEVIQVLHEITLPLYVDTKKDPTPWLGSNAIMFPNVKEYQEYSRVYDWFPKVVLKQGSAGISLVEFGKVVLSRPATKRSIVSVNGAGDTALAGFVASHTAGANLEYCLRYANAQAGVVCGKSYTSTAMIEEVEQEMGEN